MSEETVQGSDWIRSGEKFAIIGIDVRKSRDIMRTSFPGGLTVLPNADFVLPKHWVEWLGALRIEELADCNLFLLASAPSKTSEVLDGENNDLGRAVGNWFMGLMLTSKFSASSSAFLASGARIAESIDIRQFMRITSPAQSVLGEDASVSLADLRCAAEIAQGISSMKREADWRLSTCLRIYQDARCETNVLDRIHQFVRCIEGLIAPRQGKTKRQFKSRTELFIGPQHHGLMGKIYDVRSAVEHLQEHNLLKDYERATRICLAKYEFVAEWIARTCLARIFMRPDLVNHFGDLAMIEQFWASEAAERQRVWGEPIDLQRAISSIDLDHVTDRQLGEFE